MDESFNHAELLPSSPKGERLTLTRWLRQAALHALSESGVSRMPEVLVHNEADQAQIAQIHVDAATLVAAEEVAQRHLPWSSLGAHRPETLRRRRELTRWYAQLAGDIQLFLELRSELETMSSDDISRVESGGRRMVAALWKLVD